MLCLLDIQSWIEQGSWQSRYATAAAPRLSELLPYLRLHAEHRMPW